MFLKTLVLINLLCTSAAVWITWSRPKMGNQGRLHTEALEGAFGMGWFAPNRALKAHATPGAMRTILFAGFIMITLADMTLAVEEARDRLIGTGSGSTTMEQALGFAYRNNPQLNARSARRPARPTRTFPLRSRAIGRGSPARQA